jgi:Flp pilus assembly protein TadG
MITPILILLYVGIVEVGNLLTVNRRTSSVAATAADLTAQLKSVAAVDLEDILKAPGALLTPYSTTPLKVVLSSVVADKTTSERSIGAVPARAQDAARARIFPCRPA